MSVQVSRSIEVNQFHPLCVLPRSPLGSSPEPDLEPIMLAHLKAKKLELAQLKAQLELFRKAEERMAALQLDDQSIPEIEIPKSCVVKGGSRGRQSRSHRPSPPTGNTSFKARFLDSLTTEDGVNTSEAAESETQTSDKLESVTFQVFLSCSK